jgi:hypothetical protein
MFAIISLALASLWLCMVMIDLGGTYPRRRVFHEADDAAKAILICIYLIYGAITLSRGL